MIRTALILWALAQGSMAAPAYRIEAEGKTPIYLKVFDPAQASDELPLRESLLYLGGSLTWKPAAKSVELEMAGAKAVLLLGQDWAWTAEGKLPLAAALHWRGGRLWLESGSLQALYRQLNPAAPAFVSVSAEVLAAQSAAEPSVAPPQEPQIDEGRDGSTTTRILRGPIRRIVIDAGHGGHDPGAHGARDIWEKDICLEIAKKLKALIVKKMPGVEVVMTRDDDIFVSLKDRTVKANIAGADLFVSIHNNASRNAKGRGSQVFFYDSQSSDRAAADLVKRENDEANYLDFIMMDLEKAGELRDQSIRMAQSVQDELSELGQDVGVRNRKLSHAPFYVLARTKMPAILIEVAFITNPKEAKLLSSSKFQTEVADGIVSGLKKFQTVVAQK